MTPTNRAAAEEPSTGRRVVYVGGLSEGISDDQLRDLFGMYGLVAGTHIVRHKGCLRLYVTPYTSNPIAQLPHKREEST